MSLDYSVSGEVGSRKFHLSYETVADGDSGKILLHILHFFFYNNYFVRNHAILEIG